MSAYLRTADGRRFLFDTAKCRLVFEETEYDLTGATLDIYGAGWEVADGEVTVADTKWPCKTLMVRDPFTGFGIEVPFLLDKTGEVSDAFRSSWWRRLLGR